MSSPASQSACAGIAGVILAGGRNSRFPVPKGHVRIDGVSILENILDTFRQRFKEILISTNNPTGFLHYGVPLVGDIIESRGPLSGIHSGLINSSSDVFVAAWDMPYINPALLDLVASSHKEACRCKRVDATVPMFDSKPQPLLAIYSRGAISLIEAAVKQDKTSIRKLLYDIQTNFIDEKMLKGIDPEGLSFVNINTVEDYERVFSLSAATLARRSG
ncbi:MAG: molybdenum cofactor guanylyltransferase [Nitrospiraceae bacterium]|nr:molybdenum cofactor guanylyltransferase [Nitrospiraceae bacterium]